MNDKIFSEEYSDKLNKSSSNTSVIFDKDIVDSIKEVNEAVNENFKPAKPRRVVIRAKISK